MKLSERLFDILDYYEARDTDTTPETVARDIKTHPEEIIDFLVTIIEEMTA